jgi:hypothetical protein
MLEQNEVIHYKLNDVVYIEPIGKMWHRLSSLVTDFNTPTDQDVFVLDVSNLHIEIFDVSAGYVPLKKLCMKSSKNWYKVTFNGRVITCTADQVFNVNMDEFKTPAYLKFDKQNPRFGDNLDLVGHYNYDSHELINRTKTSPLGDIFYFVGYVLTNGIFSNDKLKLSFANGCDRRSFLQSYSNFVGKDNCTIVGDADNIELGGFDEVHKNKFKELFGGEDIFTRFIPEFIINSDYSDIHQFLRGLIDSTGTVYDVDDPYGNGKFNRQWAEFKFVNKSLALQLLSLLSLINDKVYYYEETIDGQTVYCLYALIAYVVYLYAQENGKQILKGDYDKFNIRKIDYNFTVTDVEELDMECYGYGVVTDSGYFSASGLHLCDCKME